MINEKKLETEIQGSKIIFQKESISTSQTLDAMETVRLSGNDKPAVADDMDVKTSTLEKIMQKEVVKDINPSQSEDANIQSSDHKPKKILFHYYEDLDNDTSPAPEDLIAPRILTPNDMMLFGGAPKVGKSDFLISLLIHLAAGKSFLGMRPPRPLRIFYLQSEIGYHYLRERVQNVNTENLMKSIIGKNLVITSQFKMLLNEDGIQATAEAIESCFGNKPVDIIVVDPLRNVFDGGKSEAGENDNSAMLFFLRERLEALRDAVNPDAGIILVHHTKKVLKNQFEEDPFHMFSGASSLRGYYTSGIIMHQPDATKNYRKLIFELRNGPKIEDKIIAKDNGRWKEYDYDPECSANKTQIQKFDAERRRKHDVILDLIYKQAHKGMVYTINQFAEAFESKDDLGSKNSIRDRLDILATSGHIRFFKNGSCYGKQDHYRSKYGLLCVEDMVLGTGKRIQDPQTGEEMDELIPVYPTHYKDPYEGHIKKVGQKDKAIWVYHDEEIKEDV